MDRGRVRLPSSSILEHYGVRATFFNIGEQEAAWPQDVKAEVSNGFLVGEHTWNHPDMVPLSTSAQAAELDMAASEQRSLTGTSPCVFRPPYGDYNATTLTLARERHMSVWMWSVDTEDWEARGSGSAYWVDRIIDLAESEGSVLEHPVVLMHNQAILMPDHGGSTAHDHPVLQNARLYVCRLARTNGTTRKSDCSAANCHPSTPRTRGVGPVPLGASCKRPQRPHGPLMHHLRPTVGQI